MLKKHLSEKNKITPYALMILINTFSHNQTKESQYPESKSLYSEHIRVYFVRTEITPLTWILVLSVRGEGEHVPFPRKKFTGRHFPQILRAFSYYVYRRCNISYNIHWNNLRIVTQELQP